MLLKIGQTRQIGQKKATITNINRKSNLQLPVLRESNRAFLHVLLVYITQCGSCADHLMFAKTNF